MADKDGDDQKADDKHDKDLGPQVSDYVMDTINDLETKLKEGGNWPGDGHPCAWFDEDNIGKVRIPMNDAKNGSTEWWRVGFKEGTGLDFRNHNTRNIESSGVTSPLS